MEKSGKLLWSYIAIVLISAEICIDCFLNRSPYDWFSIRVAFIILNAAVMMRLLYLRNRAEKLEEQKA
jgi:hypothetical protein